MDSRYYGYKLKVPRVSVIAGVDCSCMAIDVLRTEEYLVNSRCSVCRVLQYITVNKEKIWLFIEHRHLTDIFKELGSRLWPEERC